MKNLEIDKISDDKIVLKGKKLKIRWLDRYILVWSGKEHPYDKE